MIAAAVPVLPSWGLYAAVGVFGVGLIGVLLLAMPRRPGPLSADERVEVYSRSAAGARPAGAPAAIDHPADAPLDQARDVARAVLRRNRGLETRIAERLEGAGSSFKPAEWLLLQVGVVLLAGVVGLVVFAGSPWGTALFLGVGLLAPWLWLGVARSRRRRAFDASLPDTLQLMASALSAGLSLAQACDTITRDGRDPIASEFKRVLVETRLGVGLDDALADLADRYESRDFRWVVLAIRIQREVGGNLAELLTTVAGTMREREYLRRQVRSLSAEGRLSAWIIGALPPGFLLFQLLTQPEYVMPLFTDPRGLVLLAGGALLLGLGAFWMSRMVKVEV